MQKEQMAAQDWADFLWLAMHDYAFGINDLKLKLKDKENTMHKIFISRLRINGILIDICPKYKDLTVYDLVELENPEKLETLPAYLKEAIAQAQARRQEL